MASRMIGRAACPECGFASAHIKESEKCIYRYCPECGSQHHARTERQRADLMGKTRQVEQVDARGVADLVNDVRSMGFTTASAVHEDKPTPTPSPTQEPSPTPTATKAHAAKRGSLFF